MPKALRINEKVLEDYMSTAGIQTRFELAKRMGVSASTVYRVLDGAQTPGPRFIAGIKTAFPRRNIDRLLTTG